MAKRVLIVGGGIIGLATAYHALGRGHQVTVVDRGAAGQDGCSFGNAGMIVPSHVVPLAAPGMVRLGLKWMWNPESPFWIKPRLSWDLLSWGLKFCRASTHQHVQRAGPILRDLHLASRALYETLAAEPGFDFGLVQRGLLMLCKTPHALDEEARAAATARELGIPAEVLDPRQTAQLDPQVRMDVAGSVYFPRDCHLQPARLMQQLAAAVQRQGAQLVWATEARDWEVKTGRIAALRTPAGRFEADEFVIAGGAWSQAIGRSLGLLLPLQAGKGYSLTLTKPREAPGICAILVEARVAVTPMGSSLRFGGTMEMAGMETAVNPLRVRGIVNSVPNYYPAFHQQDFDGIAPWQGLRPCSPDGLPYLGRTRRLKNLIVATGHAMMGLSLGPVTGALVSEIVSGETPSIDLRLLDPDRFG